MFLLQILGVIYGTIVCVLIIATALAIPALLIVASYLAWKEHRLMKHNVKNFNPNRYDGV